MFKCWRAAVFAALSIPGLGSALAWAQDVTLTSRDGAIAVEGRLNGYDGEFFRLDTAFGPLTVDAQGVTCDGPACPDLTAPKAVIAITGSADMAARLLAPLLQDFARTQGWTYAAGPPFTLSTAAGETLAEITFAPAPPDQAHAALISGAALLAFSSLTEPDLGSQSVALDAMVPITAADNPLPQIATSDLARVLSGEVTNWNQIGGPDMPLVLHGLAAESDLGRALRARLGKDLAVTEVHGSAAELAAAVARDPWGLAVTGLSQVGTARRLPLTDSCGFPLSPGRLAVKAQDYPLTLPVFFLKPRHRLPLVARDFLAYLSTPQAQGVIARSGLTDRSVERLPLGADGARLISAIKGAGEETTLADLQALVAAMEGAERLSLTFRFDAGGMTLDATSRDALADLAQMLEAGVFKGQALSLVGFSDGEGSAEANRDLGLARAGAVLAALKALVPGMEVAQLPALASFGEALPMACDRVPAGRNLNRRVELWMRPAFAAPPPVDSEGDP
ncbi:phosphate ABC transporter substrate-binding/OmpA family protein [Rhodobacter sp. KR11]|uniref:phosphate ABC transporter substrate-binding/OmpA family protein n=1 Tax=Rhodobacter sp. KR11 TaxID=2974588 RepID=UPI002221C2BD|nr:phosphate ABC transporter substrate-binding/OmpA family protein [Rhodobacter sp. KR11]MCW1917159.1 phosphate ABC transporter substrate-binding/OmpA family protein [Rhodobacter sp. KR11]